MFVQLKIIGLQAPTAATAEIPGESAVKKNILARPIIG
jgi:hypothetical protein